MELVIFMSNIDRMYTFSNVKNFKHTNEFITFEYFGVSSQERRIGVFNKNNIAGYAMTKESEE